MKRKINKYFSMRNSKKLLIFALILFAWSTIGIGYAYLSSNLKLAGTANIAKTSWNIHFENIKSDEFDYLIYFNDIQEDKYYYCFKDEGFHITYHRFIPKDFEEFDL